jgi:large subunit ribosomal protein L10
MAATVQTAIAQTKVNDEKRQAVAAIRESFESVRDIIFTDYRGLNVGEITDLRNRLRETQTSYKVVKNRYTKIALADMGLPDVAEVLTGPTAVALVEADAGPAAKVLIEFGRDTTVRLKGGILDGKLVSVEELDELSRLPGREQLLAMLMSAMNAPLQNLVYAMNGVAQKLVRVLQAVADKKKEEEN